MTAASQIPPTASANQKPLPPATIIGNFLAWVLVVVLLVLTVLLIALAVALIGGFFGASAARVHSVASEILLPMFEAVVTVLLGTAILKGTVTYLTRLKEGPSAGPIEFFRW